MVVGIHHLLEFTRVVLAHILEYGPSEVHWDAVAAQQVRDPVPEKTSKGVVDLPDSDASESLIIWAHKV